MSTLLSWLRDTGKLRVGRRTPETIYASFSDNLDDRTENFPITLIQDVDLGAFVVEAVNEKLERGRQENIDPEAWFADQLAQLLMANGSVTSGEPITAPGATHSMWHFRFIPGSHGFEAVQKLAHEYGEMCTARATEGIEVQVRIDGSPTADADPFPATLHTEDGRLVARPLDDE